MKLCVLLVFCIPAVFAATHSLRYVYTAVSGVIDFPEFTAVGLVDDGPFMYFDSNTMKAVPKTEWMRTSEGADYWERQTQGLIGTHQIFKGNIQTAKDRFNQSKSTGVHTFQNMYGCEWDYETGVTEGYYQYGYDGEDLVSLDLKNMRYIAPSQRGFITTQKWNNDRGWLENDKNYLTKTCIDWLKKYVQYGRSSLERKVSPEVSLLQKEPSSPVTCHATGFYPSGVMLTWQKDGEEMHEDVELGETLPNQDRTFQKISTLKVSPDDLNKHKFSCVVDHQSLKERIVKDWEPKSNLGIIIACVVVVGLAAVFIAVIVFVVMKRRNADRANNDNGSSNGDTNSDNSESVALKSPGQTTDEH